MKKTIKLYNNRVIPLTKAGLPNKAYLSKEEKKVYDEYVERLKKRRNS